jgi:succinate dehydrogenase/fumarate reductase flavoprotein subunit
MTLNLETDLLVIGGGTAGCVAAVKAQEALPDRTVLLLEKANVKRSGAIALGMDHYRQDFPAITSLSCG